MNAKTILFVITLVAIAYLLYILVIQIMPRSNADGPFQMFTKYGTFKKRDLKFIVLGLVLGILILLYSIFK